MIRLLSPHHGYGKGIYCLLCLNHFRKFAAQVLRHMCSAQLLSWSPSGIQSKDGRLSWWSGLWHNSVMKTSPPTNITKIICTVHALSLHSYWGSAKKQLYKTFKAFINTLRCESQLFYIKNARVYNATPWKELKCKMLEVAIPGSWFHHPLCSLHCFILLMNSK
jgi:hypothetical protein